MRRGTQVISAGLSASEQGAPFSEGVHFASVYYASGDPSDSPYTYGRYHNPTWTQYERALGELEGGIALSFASGMAAVAAVLGATLRRGDIVIIPSDSYYGVRQVAGGFFSEAGVEVRRAPTAGNALAQCL
ncbi:MAG: PLP-dependent transferase, partial [Blastocatellia bacterium]|nr:PLP-dependent transferase [Blastocatellia bacterium]